MIKLQVATKSTYLMYLTKPRIAAEYKGLSYCFKHGRSEIIKLLNLPKTNTRASKIPL